MEVESDAVVDTKMGKKRFPDSSTNVDSGNSHRHIGDAFNSDSSGVSETHHQVPFQIGNDSDDKLSDGEHFRNNSVDSLLQNTGTPDVEHSHYFNSKPSSLFSYIYSELTRGYWLENDEAKYSEKRDRVYIFMKIPRELEKFMTYGFFQCFDAFLYVFTFLPLRFIVGLLKLLVKGPFSWCLTNPGRVLEPAQICDLLKGIIFVLCCVLMEYVDVSMMYHLIRGQAIIKLYIFFNMLEVGDRLFASFGQDILDSLFWTATEPRERRREHFGVIPHLALAIIYVFGHAILIMFQATTLNVAFNSHNKALLTIMMSNNFVELKGSVFKKFEKNNLFQMSCSDVRERFHFLLLLAVVCIRNLTEFSWNMDHFWVLVPDVLMVMGSEFLVDWVKHAFITKFNEIPDDVYKEYTMSIAYDMVQVRQKKSHSDQLDVMSRRMGFTPLPLAVILVRVVGQSLTMTSYKTWLVALLFYLCLIAVKVLNSIILLGLACQYTDMAKQKPPSQTTEKEVPPNHTNINRRASDPNLHTSAHVEDIGVRSCFKRCTSVSGKMNVTFSDVNGECNKLAETKKVDDFVIENNLQDSTLTKALFSNSTVSLQSVGLNEEYIKDTQQQPPGGGNDGGGVVGGGGDGGSVSPTKQETSSKEDAKKGRNPQKPLSEIDRYTMCSNRII